MKKYLVIIFLACTAISCVREKVDPNAWKQTVKATIVSTQGLVWDNHDTLALFRGNDFAAPFFVSEGMGTKEGNFTRYAADPEEVRTRISTVAFYPYSKDITISPQNKLTVTLPSQQQYGKRVKALLSHVLDPEAREIQMKSCLGYIQIPITCKTSAEVSSLTFRARNDKPITGKVVYGIDGGSITFVSGSSVPEVVLSAPNVKLSASEPTIFEIALPTHSITGGYEIVITSPNGESMSVKTDANISVVQDKITTVDPIEYKPSRYGDMRVDYVIDECTLPGVYLLGADGEDVTKVVMNPAEEDAVYNSAGVFRIQNYGAQQVLLFSGITPEKALGDQVNLTIGGNHSAASTLEKYYFPTLVKIQDDIRWLYAPGKAVFILQAED